MMRHLLLSLLFLAPGLLSAQEPPVHTNPADVPPAPSQVISAVTTARLAVKKNVRGTMMQITGEGTPSGIVSWTVIFYDDSAAYHGRRVQVQNSAVVKSDETGISEGDFTKTLAFSPEEVTEETGALNQAKTYAEKKHLSYNHVRLLLQRTEPGEPLLWRTELLHDDQSLGFVFTDANGDFSYFSKVDSNGNPVDAQRPDFFTRLGRSIAHLFGG